MRCKGTTKSGTRCKRTAAGETEYCSTHIDQCDTIFGESEAKPGDEDWLDDWVDTLVDAAMVGAVVVAALTVGRFLRVF